MEIKQTPTRVLFVLPRMVSGGIERVTLNLISGFQESGCECALALRRAYGEFLCEARALTQVYEVARGGIHQFVPHLAGLIRTWRPTHVVTAFADIGALTWLAMRVAHSRARLIHGVHSTHASVVAKAGAGGMLRFWIDNCTARFVYQHADTVVAVSDGIRHELLYQFRVPAQKAITIYNPAIHKNQLIPVRVRNNYENNSLLIVAMGRLSRQKGFDILVKALRDVPQPWRVNIWGEGEERAYLERLISQYGLESSIFLCGYTADPYAALRSGDLFVLPSRWEGLPTVLIEALACQCQIVAANCKHGPSEILLGGVLGTLVPVGDVHALSQAIIAAQSEDNAVPYELLLRRASDFTVENAIKNWLAALQREH